MEVWDASIRRLQEGGCAQYSSLVFVDSIVPPSTMPYMRSSRSRVYTRLRCACEEVPASDTASLASLCIACALARLKMCTSIHEIHVPGCMYVPQIPPRYAFPGAPIRLHGKVVTGFGRGSRQMGTPTANIDPGPLEGMLRTMERGVYFGWDSPLICSFHAWMCALMSMLCTVCVVPVRALGCACRPACFCMCVVGCGCGVPCCQWHVVLSLS